MRFSEGVEEFILDCRIRKLSKRTIHNYKVLLGLLERWLIEQGVSELREVRPSHLKAFLLMKEEEGRKPQYACRFIPTCVGQTSWRLEWSQARPVHPHVRGADVM